jgi:hypothetical protein
MKQIILKDRVMKIKKCSMCPAQHKASFGEFCYIDGRTFDYNDVIPEWCPLEDAE